MSDEPERTLADNAVVFREINEKIGATARAMAHDGSLLTFLCECSSLDCAERLLLRLDEYEYVRARGECFIVVRGHEVADIERTVEQNKHYDVIETTGESAAHARARNPRRESLDSEPHPNARRIFYTGRLHHNVDAAPCPVCRAV